MQCQYNYTWKMVLKWQVTQCSQWRGRDSTVIVELSWDKELFKLVELYLEYGLGLSFASVVNVDETLSTFSVEVSQDSELCRLAVLHPGDSLE